MVKLTWRLFGAFIEKTWQIELSDNLHIKFNLKSSQKARQILSRLIKISALFQKKVPSNYYLLTEFAFRTVRY